MTKEEKEIIQEIIKSVRDTHMVVHNLTGVATAALKGDPKSAEDLRQSLVKQLEEARHSVGEAQRRLAVLPVDPPKP